MKKFALVLLVLLATALLPISAQAAPGDQPTWFVSDWLERFWSLVLDGPQSLWERGHAMVDTIGQSADQQGRDDDGIQSITANGGPMIDPIGLTAPQAPEPETAMPSNDESQAN